jgi:hypothetical protein
MSVDHIQIIGIKTQQKLNLWEMYFFILLFKIFLCTRAFSYGTLKTFDSL